MSTRYDSGPVDPALLAQNLTFASGPTAKNRLMKCPMTESLATWSTANIYERGIPTDDLIRLYERWGKGKNSFGLITTGNIATQWLVSNGAGDMIIGPGLVPEGYRFNQFKALASAAKKDGSLILGQISHPGRQAQKKLTPEVVSSSNVQLEPQMWMEFAKPYAASKEEIKELISGFADAAVYLEKASFDGIELHGAFGYLIAQFLSRTTNLRSDEYGVQNTENRLRFISEIVQAIKARVSPTFILGVKLNSVEVQEGGVSATEAKEVCDGLESLGVDFVELGGGNYEDMALTHKKESTKKREAYFIEFAEIITKAMRTDRKIKLYITGGLSSTKAMVDALKVVDGVGLGRVAAAEPQLPASILEDKVSGAIKPIAEVEEDTMIRQMAAGAQISQISRGQIPFSMADAKSVEILRRDIDFWMQQSAEDAGKMEFVSPVIFSGRSYEFEPAAAAA